MKRAVPPSRKVLARWIAIVPTAMLAWWATLLLGFGLDSLAMRFCPPEQTISSFCIADWYPSVQTGIVLACAALAGFLIVFAGALVAPAQRRLVSWALLFAAFMVAGVMAVQTGAYTACAAAILGAFSALYAVARLLDPLPQG